MKMEYDSGAILASKGYDNTFSLTLTYDDQTPVKNAKANLQAQLESYNKMIAAEEAKKKTDDKRIRTKNA